MRHTTLYVPAFNGGRDKCSNAVRRVCARVAFVDLFAAPIKNFDAAESRLNFFRKPNPNSLAIFELCFQRLGPHGQ
jgi:hypothetical protein